MSVEYNPFREVNYMDGNTNAKSTVCCIVNDHDDKDRAIFSNIFNNVSDVDAVKALGDAVFSDDINIFDLDLEKIRKYKKLEYIERCVNDYTPINVLHLFKLEQNLTFEEITFEMDENRDAECYVSSLDPTSRLCRIHLEKSEEATHLLNHKVAYFLIKQYFKPNIIVFTLMVDVNFDVVDDSVVPVRYASIIQFKPIRYNNRRRKNNGKDNNN